MSYLTLKRRAASTVPTPPPGRIILFLDETSGELYAKGDTGNAYPVSATLEQEDILVVPGPMGASAAGNLLAGASVLASKV